MHSRTCLCRVWQAALMRPLGRCGGKPSVYWGTHSVEQPSSRQRPQQINLPVTLHLDCINVELGPITPIGRTWQSHSTVILASQERLLLNRADKAFSATKLKKPLDFFPLFNPVISIANQLKECVRVFFPLCMCTIVLFDSKECIKAFWRVDFNSIHFIGQNLQYFKSVFSMTT